MQLPFRSVLVLAVAAAGMAPTGASPARESDMSSAAEYDRRAAVVRHLNIHYPVPEFGSLSEWKARARDLREHVLASAGLVPMPERCPLTPMVTGRIEGDDYTIEKVAIQTLPGFWLGGNLYRPKGKTGPFPGIANPHGHWATGRIEHQELGSIPARCVTFARMGCIAFAYDMTGYNDTDQVPHTYGGDHEALWGISLGGMQLWNSIRVLDYLESLPDVDRKRLACTGASGGGTQTFLLCAVDDRVKVAAPVNMISLNMQGGCLCENLPNLRVDCTNVEIGALMAPRPLLMVAATGDWTKNTPTEEFPAIQSVYRMMGAEDRVKHVRFDAPHNYNLASREAVYAWFGRWLLGITDPAQLRERPFPLEDPLTLRTFPGTERPEGRLGPAELTASLARRSEAQLEALWPKDRESLRRFRDAYLPALRHSLGADAPDKGEVVAEAAAEPHVSGSVRAERLFLGRKGRGERVPALLLTRADRKRPAPGVVAVSPDGIAGLYDAAAGKPAPLVQSLLGKGRAVLLIDAFLTGESKAPESRAKEIGEIGFFTTYNRTDTDNRVQDILTALAYLRERPGVSRVQLAGTGAAGLWGLLACALDAKVDAAALDLAGFDPGDDARYLHELWVPGLRRAGDLRTAAALCAPRRLLLHGAHMGLPAAELGAAYHAAGKPEQLALSREPAGDAEVVAWLTR